MAEENKILIAIDNDFIRDAYYEVLTKNNFSVLKTKNGKEALDLIKKEKPSVVLLDVLLSEMGGLDVLKVMKKDAGISQIPVIIFAQLERKEDKLKAMDLEARDFISAANVSPVEVIRRIRILLGAQKSYTIDYKKTEGLQELAEDLGESSLKCSKCGEEKKIHLIRDLSRGENEFILSFVCPKCDLKK
jgi:DNA-binding response OmpR family regulator